MIAYVAPAPAFAPASLEAAFAAAKASVKRAAPPSDVLGGTGSIAAKLAAIDALHSGIPFEPKPKRIAALDALAAAASSTAQPPEVRAKALTYIGYAMPQVDDDAARSRGLTVLLAALKSPAYAVYALRGLGPACHDLPEVDESRLQGALLDLLDGPAAGEERQTALVALFSFVSSRSDLAKRAPALVAQLDARLLGPMEADPAAFAADPRSTPGAREMAIAAVWSSARHRRTDGDLKPASRVDLVLDRLLLVERDPAVLAWLRVYRDAAPPALRDSTTKRAPAGPDEP